jgi:hypothetical protein
MNTLARLVLFLVLVQCGFTLVNMTEIVGGTYLNTGQANNANTIDASNFGTKASMFIFQIAGTTDEWIYNSLFMTTPAEQRMYWSRGGLLGDQYINIPSDWTDAIALVISILSSGISLILIICGMMLLALQIILNIFVTAPQFYTNLISVITPDTALASTYGGILGFAQTAVIIFYLLISFLPGNEKS